MQPEEKRLKAFDTILIILAVAMLFVGIVLASREITANSVIAVVACTLSSLIIFPIRYVLWRKSVSHYAIPKWLMLITCITYFLAFILFIIGMWTCFLIPDGYLQYIFEALAIACIAIYSRFEKRVEGECDSHQGTG